MRPWGYINIIKSQLISTGREENSMSSNIVLPGIHLRENSIPPKVLVCGDPFRAEFIASQLDNARNLAKNREFWSYQGMYKGVPITVVSHGVGASGAVMAFISLIKAGAKEIVRLGTCGSLQPYITTGDMVIATAAAKDDGVSHRYAPETFPPVADFDLTMSLVQSAKKQDNTFHKGVIVSDGAFYGGMMPTNMELHAKAGAIAVEQEMAALFTVASVYGVRAAGILAVDGNALAVQQCAEAETPDPVLLQQAVERTLIVALDGLTHDKA